MAARPNAEVGVDPTAVFEIASAMSSLCKQPNVVKGAVIGAPNRVSMASRRSSADPT